MGCASLLRVVGTSLGRLVSLSSRSGGRVVGRTVRESKRIGVCRGSRSGGSTVRKEVRAVSEVVVGLCGSCTTKAVSRSMLGTATSGVSSRITGLGGRLSRVRHGRSGKGRVAGGCRGFFTLMGRCRRVSRLARRVIHAFVREVRVRRGMLPRGGGVTNGGMPCGRGVAVCCQFVNGLRRGVIGERSVTY